MGEGNRFRFDFLAVTVLISALALTGSLASAGPAYAPDLLVTLQVRPAHPLVGETVTIAAEVENRSLVPAPDSLLLVRIEGGPMPREFKVGPLEGRGTRTFELEVAFPIPGRFKVVAEADALGAVEETDEGNNRTVASILVRTDLSVHRAPAP